MITFVPYPIPVVVEGKDGYVIYVESSNQFENDIWCVCHCEDGTVRHYNTNQVKIFHNETLGIKKK